MLQAIVYVNMVGGRIFPKAGKREGEKHPH